MYTLRYQQEVPLKERTHAEAARQFGSWAAAEDFRQSLPEEKCAQMEVVRR